MARQPPWQVRVRAMARLLWATAATWGQPDDGPQAGSFRARQLQAVLRLTPLAMLANLMNAALICNVFGASVPRVPLLGWALVVVVVSSYGMRPWRRWKRGLMRPTASARAIHRVTWHAAVLACLWAVLPIMLFKGASAEQQLVLATVMTGMICAGGFALATVPRAAAAFVLVLGVATAGSLFAAALALALPMSGLLVVYCGIVLSSVWSSARDFITGLRAEASAEHQTQVVGLLLRDFEEHASDVLWEVDAEGRFCHVSMRLVAAFGLPMERLASVQALRLVARMQPRGERGSDAPVLRQLRKNLAQQLPFRDLVVPIRALGNRRWWSLSAKPLFGANGVCVGWRGVAADVTETQRATEQLTYLAHFDALTGLMNRHRFRIRVSELLAPHDGGEADCVVLLLDLDHFKTINDTLGHAAGDTLLQEMARRLCDALPPGAAVARLGGDEFAVALPGMHDEEAIATIARTLQQTLHAPCDLQGATVLVRSSIGIAMARGDGLEIDTLLNHADLALYAAKSDGRGKFCFFAPRMAAQTRRRISIESQLRGALARGEISVVFEPQVDLQRWQVTCFEALLRWNHPELDNVPPLEFIPVAEDSGLILELGDWVMRQACEQAAAWPDSVYVTVNVSAVQVMNDGLVERLRSILRETGLAPNRLELEITESTFLSETRSTLTVLHALHRMGVRIALDDFGTGYSSLAYLRSFPFHTLKIDSAFVRELMTRKDARAIVKTIIALAATLRMDTVAEGVEEPAQVNVLERYGCMAIQGHYMARPMAGDAVPDFLADWALRVHPEPHFDALTEPMPLGAPRVAYNH
jgi:diguanylate cyclase (GGDEF)-like protein/PAS domain S-box-containing protein